MGVSQPPAPNKIDDDTYMKIWQLEQEHARTRWTVATFFMGISFAIFGFSFQSNVPSVTNTLERLAGLIIYWFAYILFLRFFDFSKFLRGYLRELESSQRTDFDIQTKANKEMGLGFRKSMSATRLLFWFGVLYTIAVALIWLLLG